MMVTPYRDVLNNAENKPCSADDNPEHQSIELLGVGLMIPRDLWLSRHVDVTLQRLRIYSHGKRAECAWESCDNDGSLEVMRSSFIASYTDCAGIEGIASLITSTP
jgi:hypothetical protein